MIPPRRKLPPPRIPTFKWVKIHVVGKGYALTTENGFVLGARLDRGRGEYPTCATFFSKNELSQAIEAAKTWEKFRELNSDENIKRTHSLLGEGIGYAQTSLSEFHLEWQDD